MLPLVARLAVPTALLLLVGCDQPDTAAPIATRAGDYVLIATSSTTSVDAYWGAHVVQPGDTFPATIGSDGRLTIAGLRVSGYASPGILLTEVAGGYSGGQTHALNALGDPLFFTSSGGFTVSDTVSMTDDALLSGAIGSTATRTTPATILQDTLGFVLEPRPDLSGSGAGRYRLTVETSGGSITLAHPIGATADLALAADGVATINLDQVIGEETVATRFTDATTLAGQYSIFDDNTLTQIRRIPLTLTLAGSGAARTVGAATWSVQRNSSPLTSRSSTPSAPSRSPSSRPSPHRRRTAPTSCMAAPGPRTPPSPPPGCRSPTA